MQAERNGTALQPFVVLVLCFLLHSLICPLSQENFSLSLFSLFSNFPSPLVMAAQVEIDDQASVTELDNGEIFDPVPDDADSSSSTSSGSSSSSSILLGQGNQEHDVIKACFLSGLGAAIASDTTVASVRKNSAVGVTTRAKHLAFRIFTEAVARKNGGDPNVKYGWYAAGGGGGSREEIERILSYGFSSREVDDSRGVGIHLVPSKCSLFA